MATDSSAPIAKRTRWYRKWHRRVGLFIMAFLLLISLTGILLIWKKNSNGKLLADSKQGSSLSLSAWISFDSLASNAIFALRERYGYNISTKISRIDARPDKGMVKVIFEGHYHAIQLDAATGKVLLYEERRADFIEQLHDGSFIDSFAGTKGYAKLVYGTIAGLGLLLLTVSGFWLWFNPKRMINKKRNKAAPKDIEGRPVSASSTPTK